MRQFLTFFLLCGLVFSCSKDETALSEPQGRISIDFRHFAGTDSLLIGKVYYPNAAGNEYRVSYLKYFISGLCLYKNGRKIWQTKTPPISINAKYQDCLQAAFEQVPVGSYDSLSFAFGIVPEYNYHGGFEISNDDYDMYWPINLGGGYHFMKFEGHWRDGDEFGTFAFHVGANENLIIHGFKLPLDVQEAQSTNIIMTMNTHEWFENPYLFDLSKENGYTMGNQGQMNNLVLNGQHVFKAKLQDF